MQRRLLQELRRYNVNHEINEYDDAMKHLIEYSAHNFSSLPVGFVYAVCNGTAAEYIKMTASEKHINEKQ